MSLQTWPETFKNANIMAPVQPSAPLKQGLLGRTRQRGMRRLTVFGGLYIDGYFIRTPIATVKTRLGLIDLNMVSRMRTQGQM
jgi:hypothetical protein